MKKAIEKKADSEALEIFGPSLRAPRLELCRCAGCGKELQPHDEVVTLDLADFESLSETELAELTEHAFTLRIVGGTF